MDSGFSKNFLSNMVVKKGAISLPHSFDVFNILCQISKLIVNMDNKNDGNKGNTAKTLPRIYMQGRTNITAKLQVS